MLNPDVIRRLRKAISEDESISRFDGYFIGKSPVIKVEQEHLVCLGSEAAWTGSMRPPARIFGTPADSTCLNGTQAGPRQVPERCIYAVPNSRIIGNNVVLGENGAAYTPSPVRTDDDLKRFKEQNTSDHQGFVVTDTSSELCGFFVSRERPGVIKKSVLFLHNLEPANYGSFLFRQLPQILLALRFSVDFDAYVVPDRTAWLYEALQYCGMPKKPILTVREVSGERFDRVLLCNEFDAEGFFSEDIVDQLRELARQVEALQYSDRAFCKVRLAHPQLNRKRIFVSRRLSSIYRPDYRVLLNEAQLEEFVKKIGFDVVHPETLSFSEQLSLFDRASCVVGPSGSGMLNSLFCRPRSRVLDIESFHYTVRQHAKVYSSSGVDYAFLFGVPNVADPRPLHLKSWHVDPTVFKDAIEWLIG